MDYVFEPVQVPERIILNLKLNFNKVQVGVDWNHLAQDKDHPLNPKLV
jgi:hypothetical protein